jgi:hypothetical protein
MLTSVSLILVGYRTFLRTYGWNGGLHHRYRDVPAAHLHLVVPGVHARQKMEELDPDFEHLVIGHPLPALDLAVIGRNLTIRR